MMPREMGSFNVSGEAHGSDARPQARMSTVTDRHLHSLNNKFVNKQQSEKSFNNARIRNKFSVNKGNTMQSYPRQLERIARMSEHYTSTKRLKMR